MSPFNLDDKLFSLSDIGAYGNSCHKIICVRFYQRLDAVKIHNLKLLKRFNAKLAFGSDWHGRTPVIDVLYLQKLNVFSNCEMLKIWCEDTPRSIFPDRKIGLLKAGYEANFIVLDGNPLVDFEQIKNIRLKNTEGVRQFQLRVELWQSWDQRHPIRLLPGLLHLTN